MSVETVDLVLLLAIGNTKQHARLAQAQDQCYELAVDAGALHAQMKALRVQLSLVERERDAWRDRAYETVRALTGSRPCLIKTNTAWSDVPGPAHAPQPTARLMDRHDDSV